MKKLLLLILIFPLFVACSDDEEPQKPKIDDATMKLYKEWIVGQWSKKNVIPLENYMYIYTADSSFQLKIRNTPGYADQIGKGGTYKILDTGQIEHLGGIVQNFSMPNKNTMILGTATFYRDTTHYVIYREN